MNNCFILSIKHQDLDQEFRQIQNRLESALKYGFYSIK